MGVWEDGVIMEDAVGSAASPLEALRFLLDDSPEDKTSRDCELITSFKISLSSWSLLQSVHGYMIDVSHVTRRHVLDG